MARNVKETLLSTFVHGEDVLNEINVLRSVEQNKIKHNNVADSIVHKLHKPLRLRVNEIIDTNKHAKIIRFTSVDGYLPPFEAGQYINVFVEIDGVRTSRPYSLSSKPSERAYYEITVAKIKSGFVSDYFVEKVQVGDEFDANGPDGVFTYQPVFHSKKALYFAGGSGITPFLSMIRENVSKHLDRDMVLLYGCSKEEAALYHEELSQYAKTYDTFEYHFVASSPKEGYEGETGFIDAALVQKLVPDYKERTSYICGPGVMITFVYDELVKLGLPRKRIRREMFGEKNNIISEAGWPTELSGDEVFKCKINGREFDVRANENLLSGLERNNVVNIKSSCRSGECSLCRIKLVCGKVFISKGALMRVADEKFNYIHSCKAFPISDVEIEF